MDHHLHVFGLTGGIATGKSTFASLLKSLYPDVVVFDADVCVRRLYDTVEIRKGLRRYFGEVVIAGDLVDKDFIRKRSFSNSEDKLFLEGLFHPKVKQECLALLEETARRDGSRLFVADIPLLFEKGFDFSQSANLLVATSNQTQIDRLKKRNVWQDGLAEAVIASQIDIEAKLTMADFVFWNEGPVDVLKLQCVRFLKSLGLSEELYSA